jgi:hypothetical protein
MKRVGTKSIVVALILGAMFVVPSGAQSSGGPYRIEPVVIAGGGGPITGGNYQIVSTLGQSASGTMAGASYALFAGFWSPVGDLTGESGFTNGFESE